ncbi:MAG: hypothetical protein RL033_6260 [Pseudomonadota bacterium]
MKLSRLRSHGRSCSDPRRGALLALCLAAPATLTPALATAAEPPSSTAAEPPIWTAAEPPTSTAAAPSLSAEQAVRRAATGNPTLRAALLDAVAARHSAQAEHGARAPKLVLAVEGEHSEVQARAGSAQDPDGTVASSNASQRTVDDAVRSRAALTYTNEIGTELELGTSAGLSWQRRLWSGVSPLPENLSLGPTYSAEAYLSARQPLARGAGRDVQLAPQRQAEASARAASSRSQQAASQTALDVLDAYWALWYAEHSVAVQEQAQTVAQRLVRDAELRVNTLGTAARVDVLQFSTSAAGIADALSRARAEQRGQALELGRLLGLAPEAARTLAASDEPPELGLPAAADALSTQLETSSPALAALRADLERARSRAALARDADQPRIDLFARASVGTLWDESTDFSLSGGRPAYGVLGGIELELPLGSGRAPSDAAAAQVELEAAEARYRAELQALAARAQTLGGDLEAAREQVTLSTQTASSARELAEAERQRLILGTTTAQNVVSAEQTAREAELRRLQALVAQLTTRFQLEHATGTLLTRFATL